MIQIFYVPKEKQKQTIGEEFDNPIIAVYNEESKLSVNFQIAKTEIDAREMIKYLNEAITKLCQEESKKNSK